jgi:hypothetical protein
VLCCCRAPSQGQRCTSPSLCSRSSLAQAQRQQRRGRVGRTSRRALLSAAASAAAAVVSAQPALQGPCSQRRPRKPRSSSRLSRSQLRCRTSGRHPQQQQPQRRLQRSRPCSTLGLMLRRRSRQQNCRRQTPGRRPPMAVLRPPLERSPRCRRRRRSRSGNRSSPSASSIRRPRRGSRPASTPSAAAGWASAHRSRHG